MPSAITPSFRSKFSVLGRSKRSASTDENANAIPNPRDKTTPRRSTSQAPTRTPLIPLQPQPPIISTSKAERGHKGVTTAAGTSGNAGDKPTSMKKTFSTMLSNVIRRSSSRKDAAPVRGGDGKFLPPMHLANRKGSRYAEPKLAPSAPTNGAVSVRHAPVARPETTRLGGENAAKEVAPVQRRENVRGLRPLRLVNKVLSEGHPVANLVPGSHQVEVNQKVVDNEETNERVLIVEMKIAKNSSVPTPNVKRADAGRNAVPKPQATSTLDQKYPLKRRSVPYKPVITSPQVVREVSESSNVAVSDVRPVKVNEHTKPHQHLDRDSTRSEKRYEYATVDVPGTAAYATKQTMLHGKEITGSVECDLVSTSLDIDTSSMSSASTSVASTPTPSPVKPAPKLMSTGLAKRKPSAKDANGPQNPKVAASKLKGQAVRQERVRSKNFRASISTLFAKSTVNVKQAVVPTESVVPPVTVSNLPLEKAAKDMEVKDERVLEGNKHEEACYVKKDREHAAQVPVDEVGVNQTPSESDENDKADKISSSSDVTQNAEAVKINSVTPPSRVGSLLQRFQQLTATPQCSSSSPPNAITRGSWTPSPTTTDSPAVYSLRPAIPAHLANKTVANPDIQLELDFLRTTSVAARSRTVLQRAKMFRTGGSGSSGSDSDGSGGSAPSTPGGVWHGLRTPVTSSPGSDTDRSENEDSPESKLSLRAMAIAHRVRNSKRG